MRVEHVMTRNPVTCENSDTIRHVAGLMRDKNVGSVIVMQNRRLAGIVTDRQLALHALADGAKPEDPVEQVMTRDPARVTPDETIFNVVDTFRSAGVVRRVPVVNESEQILGVVSVSDLAVVAKKLLDGVMLEETHHALEEARIMTGGKHIQKRLRRPAKAEDLPEQEVKAQTAPTRPGPPPKSGRAGNP